MASLAGKRLKTGDWGQSERAVDLPLRMTRFYRMVTIP